MVEELPSFQNGCSAKPSKRFRRSFQTTTALATFGVVSCASTSTPAGFSKPINAAVALGQVGGQSGNCLIRRPEALLVRLSSRYRENQALTIPRPLPARECLEALINLGGEDWSASDLTTSQHIQALSWLAESLGSFAARAEGIDHDKTLPPISLVTAAFAALVSIGAGLSKYLGRVTESLHTVICTRLAEASQADLVSAAWAFAKLKPADNGRVQDIFREAEKQLPLFSSAQLSKLAWALATVQSRLDGLALGRQLAKNMLQKIGDHSVAHIRGMRVQNFVNLIWAFASLDVVHMPLLDTVSLEASLSMQQLSHRDIAQLAWSFAKLHSQDWKLLSGLADAALQEGPNKKMKLMLFNSQDLALLSWSWGTVLLQVAPATIAAVAGVAKAKLNTFRSQELSNLYWAFARLLWEGGQFDNLLIESSLMRLQSFSPQNLSNLVWAAAVIGSQSNFASASLSEREAAAAVTDLSTSSLQLLFQASEQQVLRRATEFKSQELCNFVWAMATVRIHPESVGLMEMISSQVVLRATSLSAQDLSNLAWSMVSLPKFDLNDFMQDSAREVAFWRAIANASLTKICDATPQGLVNLAWAFACEGYQKINTTSPGCASCEVCDVHLGSSWAEAISEAVTSRLQTFTSRTLANLSWSFAAMGIRCAELFGAASFCLREELMSLIAEGRFEGPARRTFDSLARDTTEVIWAQAFAGCLDQALLSLAMKAFRCRSANLSTELGKTRLPARDELVPSLPTCTQNATQWWSPHVLVDLPDRCIVWKPPNWEVDDERMPSDELGAFELSRFWTSWWPPRQYPLVADRRLQCGFLHRLDVPSSGLLLCAKEASALLDLQLQLAAGQLFRDYVVLCHGWTPPFRNEIAVRISSEHSSTASSFVSSAGRPSLTFMKLLAHGFAGRHQEVAISLLALRLGTGRKHQIRVHTAHIGHPTVADGRYTSTETFESDSLWCPRNFLHRYSLEFRDVDTKLHTTKSGMPPDLQSVLATASARPGSHASKADLGWFSTQETPSWNELAALKKDE